MWGKGLKGRKSKDSPQVSDLRNCSEGGAFGKGGKD